MAAFTTPPGRSNSGPSKLTPFSLTLNFVSWMRMPVAYSSVAGSLHWNCVGSQNRLRYGTFAGLVQVAMAGVLPAAAVPGIVQPRAADSAALFTPPCVKLWLEV